MSGRHYSVSSVQMYLACPRQFYLAYVKRIKREERDVPIPWRLGTAVHGALETAFSCRAEDVQPVESMTKYEKQALERLEEEWVKLSLPRTHGTHDWGIDVVQKTLEHVHVPEKRTDVLGTEYKILGSTDDGNNFVGYADLVLRTGGDTLKIRDWKVTSNASTMESLVDDFQLNSYAWFLQREFPWAKRVVASHYYPPLTREVQFEVRTDCMEDAITRIDSVAEWVDQDQEYKPRPGTQCENCQFIKECPAWSDRSEALNAIERF